MNEKNQSDVAYEGNGVKDAPEPSMGKDKQFPGDKMPQGNKMQKKRGTKMLHGKSRHGGEHR